MSEFESNQSSNPDQGVAAPPVSSVPEHSAGRLKARLMKCGAVAAAAVLAAGVAASEYVSGDPMFGPKYAKSWALGDACPEVEPQAISQTERLLRGTKEDSSTLPFGLADRAKLAAEASGLTVVDRDIYLANVISAKNNDQIMSSLQAYTSKFGFEVKPVEHRGLRDMYLGVRPIKIEDVPLNDLRFNVLVFMANLSILPKELVEYSGLDTVKLADSLGDLAPNISNASNFRTGGIAEAADGDIYVGLETMDDDGVISHEVSHLVDYKMCGGYYQFVHDPGFVANNGRGFVYGRLTPQTKQNIMQSQNDTPYYGANNAIEDKATIYSAALGGVSGYALDGFSSPLTKKYIYLMARLDQHVPGMARYLQKLGSQGNG